MTWLYVPSACAVEPAGLTSGSTKARAALDWEVLARSLWWRGKRSPSPLWQRRWSKVAWLRRLSGLTSEPSMLARGVESWIASLEATPVSRLAWPEHAPEQTTRDTSGQMSLAFFESASPHSASSRTSPVICLSEAARSSESFKQWATELRRHCGQRRKSARLTVASGSLSLLPTPSACSYGSNQGGAAGRTGKERHSLESMARRAMWPTPTSTLGTNGGLVTPAKGREGGTLIEALSARTWPTPMASDWKRNGMGSEQQRDSPNLPAAVRMRGLATQVGGQLNPTWVEWLMGWPLGWTASACSGMASSPRKRLRRSSSSGER